MIRKLLLSFLFFLLPFFKIRSEKFSFKIAFIAILLGFSFNAANAQCNTPTNVRGDNESCNGYIARWDGSAPTAFYIDVATSTAFDAASIVSAYNNKNVGNTNSINLTGLNPSTTYYFRVRSSGSAPNCTSGNSATKSFTTLGIETPRNIRAENGSWCSYKVLWDGSATKFYLDVATTNTFDSGTILPAYNNIDLGNTNSLTLTGLNSNTQYYFRLRRLENCGLSGNSSVGNFKTLSIPTPTANNGFASCNNWTAQWNNASVDGYYLDVAIDNNFTNYLAGYQNLDVGNVISYNLTGLANGGTYYYRVRSKTSCGAGNNSNVITFTEKGNGSSTPGTISGGNTSICPGSATQFTVSGSNPSNGTWSVFNQTGAATISNTGLLSATKSGTVTVVYTVGSGCVSSTTKSFTIAGGTVGAASSTPTICLGTVLTPITHTTSGFTGIGTPSNLPPGTSASFNNNTITITGNPTSTGTYNYSIPLNGGSCGTANASGTIKINPTPVITSQPTSPVATCSGSGTQTISVAASGTNLTYVWKQGTTTITNGGVYSGQNTATLTLTNPTTANQGNYTVEISGDCATTPIISNQVAVTINSAPVITTQPAIPASTCSGNGTQTITVAATGTNLTYVWKKDGTTIINGGIFSGQNTATLTLTNPTTAAQGNYTVVITGTCTPVVTSNSVAIMVNSAPVITTQPVTPASTCSGNGTQSMTVIATGTGLTYQWRKDGSNLTNGTVISGATSATLTLTNPTASDAGSYDVIVTGACTPAVTSTARTVTIYALPTIIETPQAKTCANRHIAYNTQGGKTNYIWSVSGTLNTDYKIIDRGTATDSYIIIEWLTVGSRTVSVNYTNPSGCSAPTPGTYTTEIVILDKGQVNGGKHICPGETLPTLTFNTYANSSIRYTDTSVISKWQYSDGNNTNYQDIPGTSGLTSYTPSSIPGSTRQYRVVVDNGTCTDQSIYSAIDIDVTTAITSQSTAGQSVCIGTSFTPISVTAVGTNKAGQTSLSYKWYSTTQNNNTTGSVITGATANTYTPQSTTAGTLYYYCIVTGQCGSATSAVSGAFVTNANPSAPSAIVTTQPTCSGTKGTITITGTSGYTYSINGTDYYNQTVFNSLDPGPYTVTAKNASGCLSQTGTLLQVNTPAAKTWTGANGTSWNLASNWSPSGIPSNSDCVIIPAGVTNSPVISDTNVDSNAYTLTVNDNASLIVEIGCTLRVNSAVTVLSSATTTGTLLFKNNSSLVQTDTDPTINSGKISYMRTSLPIRQADYVYWSTPVKGQTLAGVSPLTASDKYYSYNGTKWISNAKTTVMTVGKGYIIRGPENYSNTTRTAFEATFKGTPNNGTLSGETVAANKYYLVGNPYPSALEADQFILANKTILDGTLYFWTHNTPVVLGGAYEYADDDYASYNVTGSVKTAAPSGTKNGNNNDKPSGKIGAGQSFFVSAIAPGTISFTNLMRSGGVNNSQFFKPATAKTTSLEKHRVWLNMTNSGGAFKQLLVGYVEGATNDVENIYDGATFDGNKYLDFYSINAGNNLVIQGRGLPFTDTDTVPLGYRTTISGEFTIAIDEADGDMATQKIYLEDKTTAVIHDLTASNYTFTTVAGTFADRFVLRYTNKSLGTGDFENIENGLLVSVKDKTIKVLSSQENIKEVSVYDISGRLLYNKTKVGSNEFNISNLQSSNQVLIVKVTLENDFKVSKKIIFQ